MKIIITIFILLMIFPNNVYAYCDYSDLSRLKKIAANVNLSIDYIENNDNVTFNITLNNLTKDLYVYDTTNNKNYYFTNTELVLPNYKGGTKINYIIKSAESNCTDKVLYNLRTELPFYNKFYKDDLCKGIENYNLCQKWRSTDMSYDKFKKNVVKYKNSITKKENEEQEYKNYPFLDFLYKYYYVILICVILLCGLGIYMLNKKSNIYN